VRRATMVKSLKAILFRLEKIENWEDLGRATEPWSIRDLKRVIAALESADGTALGQVGDRGPSSTAPEQKSPKDSEGVDG